jgi:tetratricopeptide (TPR) repeat protein
MRVHILMSLLAALTLAWSMPASLHAQESDPVGSAQATLDARQERLDELFGKLKAGDGAAGNEIAALKIESQIWGVWMEGNTPEETAQLALASKAMAVRDFALCEKLLNDMIAKESRHSEVWNKRATLYYLMGKDVESLSDITRTLELEPRHFGALSGCGMIYVRQGKMGDALAAYREALDVNPYLTGARAAVKQLEALMPDL